MVLGKIMLVCIFYICPVGCLSYENASLRKDQDISLRHICKIMYLIKLIYNKQLLSTYYVLGMVLLIVYIISLFILLKIPKDTDEENGA